MKWLNVLYFNDTLTYLASHIFPQLIREDVLARANAKAVFRVPLSHICYSALFIQQHFHFHL